MIFLLDTDAVSELALPRPSDAFRRRLRENQGDVAIPAPAWCELCFGWRRMPTGRRRDVIGDYLRRWHEAEVPIVAYDAAAAEWHASERARLEAAGRRPPFVDGQIAAIAAVRDLVLVTRNRRDYASFTGLRVEDWTR